MTNINLPAFANIPITAQNVVSAGRFYLGLDYSEGGTFAHVDDDGHVRGQCNCWGLLFLIAGRLGLIEPGYWRALLRAMAKHGIARVLLWVLETQLQPVDIADVRPGDLLLFRWKAGTIAEDSEVSQRVTAAHHVAFYTASDPAPLGTLLHAVDTDASGRGAVVETPVAGCDWVQLLSAHRLPQIVAEGGENG